MHLSYKEQVLLLLILSCWFCTILSCQPGQLCQWTSWHPWAACNTTCGSGVQSRWRGVCCDDQAIWTSWDASYTVISAEHSIGNTKPVTMYQCVLWLKGIRFCQVKHLFPFFFVLFLC